MKKLIVLALAAGTLATFAPASNAWIPPCGIRVYDETPGTYPGGMHVYQNCISPY